MGRIGCGEGVVLQSEDRGSGVVVVDADLDLGPVAPEGVRTDHVEIHITIGGRILVAPGIPVADGRDPRVAVGHVHPEQAGLLVDGPQIVLDERVRCQIAHRNGPVGSIGGFEPVGPGGQGAERDFLIRFFGIYGNGATRTGHPG